MEYRLYHYELIPFLPDELLLSTLDTLYDIMSIKPKDDLINYVYDFMDNKVHEDGGIRRIEKKDVMVYAENCIAALDSKLFSQMVHPDVFMRCIRAEDFDSRMEECSRAIIESAVKNEVCLEINTSDIFRSSAGFCRLRYPAENFWKIVSGYKNARVLIGTDAHEPERIADFQMEYVSDFMERFKLKVEPAMKI